MLLQIVIQGYFRYNFPCWSHRLEAQDAGFSSRKSGVQIPLGPLFQLKFPLKSVTLVVMKLTRAFTLIEVLTTIAIIGILATITVYGYGSSLARSRDNQRLADVATTKNALEQFYLDNRTYPKFEHDDEKWIFASKWQLEKTTDCAQQAGKLTLAPFYLASVPQDPRAPFTSANCSNPGQIRQDGQYLYLALPKPEQASNTGFTLMAKMERPQNYSDSNWQTGLDPVYTGGFTEAGLSYGTDGSQNYYLRTDKNSRNQ